jgi:hypothetical protein
MRSASLFGTCVILKRYRNKKISSFHIWIVHHFLMKEELKLLLLSYESDKKLIHENYLLAYLKKILSVENVTAVIVAWLETKYNYCHAHCAML